AAVPVNRGRRVKPGDDGGGLGKAGSRQLASEMAHVPAPSLTALCLAALCLAASIAASTRSGLSGRAHSPTPRWRRASLTAETIAAGGPTAPPSPMPLAPNEV